MQMRWYTSAATTLGYTYTDFDIENVTKVEFVAKNSNNMKVAVSYSTDAGATWQGAQTFDLTSSKATYTYTVNAAGVNNVRLRFDVVLPATNPTSTSRVYIDDVKVSGMK